MSTTSSDRFRHGMTSGRFGASIGRCAGGSRRSSIPTPRKRAPWGAWQPCSTTARKFEEKARLVHTYHGHVFDGYFDSWSTRLFLFIERRLAAHTDVLVAISDRVRHDLLHTYRIAREAQIQVIPLGFDLAKLLALTDADRLAARAALDLPDRSIVVTTVGRLTGIKDHSLFLEAAANLARQSTRFVFLLVGDGELRRQLEEQSARLGIASRTRFLGWRGDLPTIYGATDVFVLTSRNEGTPVALIEAMAAGVAVVSTDVGGVGDVIPRQELGLRVGRADAQSLSDAVERLGDSPAVRAEMGRAARAFVTERFSRLRLLEDIRGLYWRLLGLPVLTFDSSLHDQASHLLCDCAGDFPRPDASLSCCGPQAGVRRQTEGRPVASTADRALWRRGDSRHDAGAGADDRSGSARVAVAGVRPRDRRLRPRRTM